MLAAAMAEVESGRKNPLARADIEAGARIFNKYPELVEKLPGDVVPVPWYYAAKPDYTLHETDHTRIMASHIPEVGEKVLMSREYETDLMLNEFRKWNIPSLEGLNYDVH